MTALERIHQYLGNIYSEDEAVFIYGRLLDKISDFKDKYSTVNFPLQRDDILTEGDVILITYGDQFLEAGQQPLCSLHKFLDDNLGDVISSVHILPFYPYSSDDGFAVIDYRRVDSKLGGWDDIRGLSQHYALMFDAVINHISRQSEWFKAYRSDKMPYKEYFITVDPKEDLSMVVRPRALPLLTPVKTNSGLRHVWTTFSDDQIDLNYSQPLVLLEIIDLLLYYVARGASLIRLDAIAYLWKEKGTSCIHLPQTHYVVKLFRAILDEVAPHVLIITETNVPHEDNISYFGELLPETGMTDEAQLVYQFPLAPLILHTFRVGNITRLSDWAKTLNSPSSFLNFFASHDGIGLLPAYGLLTDGEIQALVERTISHGGQVSYKVNSDGSRRVYELNVTLYDVLNNPDQTNIEIGVLRFLATQAIMISLAGVPGIYVHSLFGSRNCTNCVEKSGRARSINREKFQYSKLLAELQDKESRTSRIFFGYKHLLRIRKSVRAFHPSGAQRILHLHPGVFSLIRYSPGGDECIVCLTNVTSAGQEVEIPLEKLNLPLEKIWSDLIEPKKYDAMNSVLRIPLRTYQTLWLRPHR